ncbi:MAG TPA: hypothetical protein VN151_04690 [Terracidiphilus sp.]|nr:hypothetical protein [Terracidiphilus sp.]
MNPENPSSHQGHREQDPDPSQAGIVCPQELDQAPDPPAPLVLEALKHILESEFFRTSTRGRQFLTYVVQYRLERHPEPLKERMIGAALFHRPLDYVTGDDSVVRAQAREVRRRLEKYYIAYPTGHELRIALPTGSYAPEFRLEARQPAIPAASLALPGPVIGSVAPASPAQAQPRFKNYRFGLLSGVAITLLVLATGIGLTHFIHLRVAQPALTQFWSPALSSSKPVLICLPKPVFYRPTVDLYKRSEKYPGEFDHEVYRMNHRPHLDVKEPITWGDIVEYWEYGVGRGDVLAAVHISNFLGRQNKDNEVRIGDGYNSQDLRNSPAIVIGAYSNPSSIDLTKNLHYYFADDDKGMRIQEQGAQGHSWPDAQTQPGVDYGLVARLLDSDTGQFVVIVAGMTGSGSDAAADLVTNPRSFDAALSKLSKGWAQKNLEIVVSTQVSNAVAGPPKVVSAYSW